MENMKFMSMSPEVVGVVELDGVGWLVFKDAGKNVREFVHGGSNVRVAIYAMAMRLRVICYGMDGRAKELSPLDEEAYVGCFAQEVEQTWRNLNRNI